MSIDINWIQAVAGLVLGFLLKVLFDELKSAKLRIVGVSQSPFSIEAKYKVIGTDFDNYYIAYRIRVENKQKRYMNCAAENCIAWLELDNAREPFQICWVGDFADVTINVGDVREVDFCARGNTTGTIYAPTERGYFELSPREIGDGKSELRGKLRITSKNGRKAEKRFVIKPNNKQLEIDLLNKHNRRILMTSTDRLLSYIFIILCLALILVPLFFKACELFSSFNMTKPQLLKYICHSIAGLVGLVITLITQRRRAVKYTITSVIFLYVLVPCNI